MLELIIPPYLMVMFLTAMMFPIIRDAASDERHVMFRKEGETGLEYLGKMLLVSLAWPVVVVSGVYRFFTEVLIPWLTKPP